MSFANLKSKSMDISKLVAEANAASGQVSNSNKYQDDRKWKPTVDEAGNGYAVIRFLPATEGQDLPWVRYWDHAFKGPTGQWYIERSLTTLGQNDPLGELNSRLWNSGIEEDKETARRQKRRLHYVTNIQVMNDPANPANNGKTFIYEFGKKIFDKIMDQMQPEFPGETPVNPFDFWTGAFFELKIRNVAGYRNYDKSDFKAPTAFLDGDEVQLEAVYNGMYDLNEFIIPDYAGAHDPKYFKSYDELKNKLETVLGLATGAGSTLKNEALAQSAEAAPVRSAIEPTIVAAAEPVAGIVAKEEDDTLSYFAQMAAED
jgi:hypothetical protein|tara:strand:- start:3974 stop:4921 length:948 start_codon:yes stop_codon:yes gene_type:complete